VTAALLGLAHDLVALARDMRIAHDPSDWLLAQFGRSIDQLPQSFDLHSAKASVARIFREMATSRSPVEVRDLFLVYLPEDRLPIAAPLAIDLVKRRVSVAFSEYEVATPEELEAAVQRGLKQHRGGVVLWTTALQRSRWDIHLPETERLRVVRDSDWPRMAVEIANWAQHLRARSTAI
jgi:hypothetical protein